MRMCVLCSRHTIEHSALSPRIVQNLILTSPSPHHLASGQMRRARPRMRRGLSIRWETNGTTTPIARPGSSWTTTTPVRWVHAFSASTSTNTNTNTNMQTHRDTTTHQNNDHHHHLHHYRTSRSFQRRMHWSALSLNLWSWRRCVWGYFVAASAVGGRARAGAGDCSLAVDGSNHFGERPKGC